MEAHQSFQMRLQVGLREARDRDAIVVPKFNHRVAMGVAGDKR